MDRILISWIASKNDFDNENINVNGPTFNFHLNFYNGYKKHIILTADPEFRNNKSQRLIKRLQLTFPDHIIELKHIPLSQKEVIDFNQIHFHIYPFILDLSDKKVEIFVSPGTPTMQVVWHMLQNEFPDIKLLQTIKREDSDNGRPSIVEINISQSPRTEFLILKEQSILDKKTYSKDYIITDSIKPIYSLAYDIALASKTTVLIRGETGTGKEHIAKEIHNKSSRKGQPYLTVNCAAINPDLLESRLFGYEKGAFTNALSTTEGYFQAADGGTIFLDEIGDISPQMQVALLRVLQEGEVQKVGSNQIEKIDVRLITATNKDLYKECELGNLRWDLYYRLCVTEIVLPSLKERGPRDMLQLLDFFNNKYYRQFKGRRNLLTFSDQVIEILTEHNWPGNIRELQNLVESCYAYGYQIVKPENLPKNLRLNRYKKSKILDDVIKYHIQTVVEECSGNLSKAKRILGIGSINTIKKYIQ